MSSMIFPSEFPADIQRAYRAGLYADLQITCGVHEFKVHKLIVCSQSRVFEATCSNGFRESLTNSIDLSADGISLVSRMIHCLYHGTYEDSPKPDDPLEWKSPHQLHAAMYALGDKYELKVLKDAALVKFNELPTVTANPEDVQALIDSIALIYSSTPDSDRQLRDATVTKIRASPVRFLQRDVSLSFRKVLCEVPDFSWDLHQHWMKSKELEYLGTAKRRR